MISRLRFVLVLALALVALGVWNSTRADAATYANDCPAIADDLTTSSTTTSQCLAITQRLEQLDADVLASSSSSSSSGTVALSPDDAHRLDLTWWGCWAAVGVALLAILSPLWVSAFGLERKMAGRG
jgi:hypothetical protein